MHGIGAPQRMRCGEFAGVMLDGCRQLDWPSRAPELLPALLGLVEVVSVKVMVSMGGSESRPDLGISQPARYGGVTTIPEGYSQLRTLLLDDKLHEGTGIEVDQGHLSDVAR